MKIEVNSTLSLLRKINLLWKNLKFQISGSRFVAFQIWNLKFGIFSFRKGAGVVELAALEML